MGRPGHFLALLFLLVVAAMALAVNPGLEMEITKNGINYANTIAQALIRQKLHNLTIPDQSGKSGHLSWSLSNIKNKGISGPNTSVALSPVNNGVQLSFSNFEASLSTDYHVKYKILFSIKNSGSIDAKVSGVSLNATVGLGQKNGRPTVTDKGCTCSIKNVDIKLHGGILAKIVSLFRKTIDHKVRDLLQSKVCDITRKAINGLANEELAKLKVSTLFEEHFAFNYSLISAPVVTSSYIQTRHKGEIYWNGNRQANPFLPAVIPTPTSANRMLYIGITEYMANSFSFVAQHNHFLQYKISIRDVLQHFSIIKKNATQSVPFHADTDVEFRLSTLSQPMLRFTHQKLNASISGDIEVVKIKPNGDSNIFSLGLSVSVTLQPSIVNEKVLATIAGYTFDFNIRNSTIGELDKQELKSMLKLVIDTKVLPAANNFGRKGIELPVTGSVKFYNTGIDLESGYMMISTDIKMI